MDSNSSIIKTEDAAPAVVGNGSADLDAALAAKRKAEDNLAAGYDVAAASAAAPPPAAKKPKPNAEEEELKRHARLESNRKAARESRRRKKVLVEELQRSVIFFTRANAQLKQKNESLEGMLFAARSQIDGTVAAMPVSAIAAPVQAASTEDGTKPAAASFGHQDPSSAAASDQMATLQAQAAQQQQSVSAPQPAAAQAQAPGGTSLNQLQQQQNNNAIMANWLAMAQAATTGMVPNPMLASIPGIQGAAGMGMFNPMAAMAGNAGLMGMAAAAGMGNPFLGGALQQQQQQQQQAAFGQQFGQQQAPTTAAAAPVANNTDGSSNNNGAPAPPPATNVESTLI